MSFPALASLLAIDLLDCYSELRNYSANSPGTNVIPTFLLASCLVIREEFVNRYQIHKDLGSVAKKALKGHFDKLLSSLL